jgi:Protein of unknown function (DUF3800)
MKFVYVDESGSRDQGDVFTMCGLMVDAYKLRKKTEDFDTKLEAIFAQHPGVRNDFKASRFINGKGGWRDVEVQARKDLLRDLCELAIDNGGKVFGIGLSFQRFDQVLASIHARPFGNSYWLAASMFTCSLIQKRMQTVSNSKGLTVVIMDDNKVEMPKLTEALHRPSEWYDGLYQMQGRTRRQLQWLERRPSDRFDQIINTAFAIKSDHSSLVQVADAICYVYRRHLELLSGVEAWQGETDYYAEIVTKLDGSRERLGRCPDSPSVQFFGQARHQDWSL